MEYARVVRLRCLQDDTKPQELGWMHQNVRGDPLTYAALVAAAAASLERGQKKRSLDQLEEMTEDDFTVEFPDLKLGRLYEHFQAMQNKVNALERTAKQLEARVVELEVQSFGE